MAEANIHGVAEESLKETDGEWGEAKDARTLSHVLLQALTNNKVS